MREVSARGAARSAKGGLTAGPRNDTVAAVMRGDGALALYVDLQAVAALLPGAAGPAGGILADLDYLTVSAGNRGAAVESEAALFVRGGSFRETLLPKLFAAMASAGFGSRKESRRFHDAGTSKETRTP